MPIYEMNCTQTEACRKWERRFLSLAEYDREYHAGQIKCPVCGSIRIERLNSMTAPPQFSGSGFYETDYKRK